MAGRGTGWAYLHGGAATGDPREAHDVGEVDGDGGESLGLHVLSALEVLRHLSRHNAREHRVMAPTHD